MVKDRFRWSPIGIQGDEALRSEEPALELGVLGSLFGGCTPLPLAREGEFLESASAVIRGAHL